MKFSIPKFAVICGVIVACVPAYAADETESPAISHFPTLVGYRGQPIPVYANIESTIAPLESVELYFAQTPEDVSTKIPMKAAPGDRYSGAIPATFFSGSDKIWYLVAAVDTATNITQTRWYPVTINNPEVDQADGSTVDSTLPAGTGSAGPEGSAIPAGKTTGVSYGKFGYKEAGLLAGAVVVGAVAVDSLSGGGGGGSGFDDSNTISVPASGRSSGGFSSGPQDTIINGTAQVGGRTIRGVRVTVFYSAYTVPDQFQIIYEGSKIADSGVVSGSDSIQGTGRGSSPIVTIRVLTPRGGTAWDWSATVEFSVVAEE